MKQTLERNYNLCHYECDKNGEIRIVTLMNILQNIAQMHIAQLGYGVEEFAKKSLVWVTAKYHVVVKQPPKTNEEIKILTWISGTRATSAIREFLITNQNGDVLVEVLSKWALIDMIRGRPAKIPECELLEKNLFQTTFTLPNISQADLVKEFPVMHDNIDFNQHVNNSLYPLWASESVGTEFRAKHSPKEIIISFQKEALLGETISVSTQLIELDSVHVITSKKDGRELSKVAIKWN